MGIVARLALADRAKAMHAILSGAIVVRQGPARSSRRFRGPPSQWAGVMSMLKASDMIVHCDNGEELTAKLAYNKLADAFSGELS